MQPTIARSLSGRNDRRRGGHLTCHWAAVCCTLGTSNRTENNG